MKQIIWAVVTMTALAAPAFAQSTSTPSTTTVPTKADVKHDRQTVHQDRATLKADQAAGRTADVAKDQAKLKKDREELRADMKAAGVTAKHHKNNRTKAPKSGSTTSK